MKNPPHLRHPLRVCPRWGIPWCILTEISEGIRLFAAAALPPGAPPLLESPQGPPPGHQESNGAGQGGRQASQALTGAAQGQAGPGQHPGLPYISTHLFSFLKSWALLIINNTHQLRT